MAEVQNNRANAPNLHDDTSPPVYQSKLRAKREERRQQRHLDSPISSVPPATTSAVFATMTEEPATNGCMSTSRTTTRSISTADEAKRRQRAEARRLLIEYPGTAWDAVRVNDLHMLRNFFLVEGATKLVQAHTNSLDEFGRTLLHTAAWWGHLEAVEYLIANGAAVDEIDSYTTRLTPLMDAARAGHADVGCMLLDQGADATMKDSSGDNAFHWAARHANGLFLLRASLKLDKSDHRLLEEAWTAKNVRGRSPVDYIRTHSTIFPMIVKLIGDRVPLYHPSTDQRRRHRLPFTAGHSDGQTVNGIVASDSGIQDLSRPTTAQRTEISLSGIDTLGIDVGSFVYKSRDASRPH